MGTTQIHSNLDTNLIERLDKLNDNKKYKSRQQLLTAAVEYFLQTRDCLSCKECIRETVKTEIQRMITEGVCNGDGT